MIEHTKKTKLIRPLLAFSMNFCIKVIDPLNLFIIMIPLL